MSNLFKPVGAGTPSPPPAAAAVVVDTTREHGSPSTAVGDDKKVQCTSKRYTITIPYDECCVSHPLLAYHFIPDGPKYAWGTGPGSRHPDDLDPDVQKLPLSPGAAGGVRCEHDPKDLEAKGWGEAQARVENMSKSEFDARVARSKTRECNLSFDPHLTLNSSRQGKTKAGKRCKRRGQFNYCQNHV